MGASKLVDHVETLRYHLGWTRCWSWVGQLWWLDAAVVCCWGEVSVILAVFAIPFLQRFSVLLLYWWIKPFHSRNCFMSNFYLNCFLASRTVDSAFWSPFSYLRLSLGLSRPHSRQKWWLRIPYIYSSMPQRSPPDSDYAFCVDSSSTRCSHHEGIACSVHILLHLLGEFGLRLHFLRIWCSGQ